MAIKKFKFRLNNVEFQLPLTSVREATWNGVTEKYIYMSAKNSASVIKQFVKKMYPQIKVWATSSVYSGGDSVRVNVSKPDGSSVSEEIFNEIKKWQYILQGGSFNGMEDIYEMRDDSVRTENGTDLRYFPNYVFIENKPKWDSVEYWLRDLRDPSFMNQVKESGKSFVDYISGYSSPTTIKKLKLILKQ